MINERQLIATTGVCFKRNNPLHYGGTLDRIDKLMGEPLPAPANLRGNFCPGFVVTIS